MTQEDRNAEIWSTRVQRELLALTTENAGEEAKEITGVLPSFVSIKDHELDIAQGKCLVSFYVDVEKPSKDGDDKPKKEAAEETEAKDDGGGGGDEETAAAAAAAAGEKPDTAEPSAEQKDSTDDTRIVVTLDVSLWRKEDGSLDTSAICYPFQKPRVILTSGSNFFPEGSTIQNGDHIEIDCDWTPSLHLSDGALNIGLKIKESILQQEPFHPSPADGVDPLDDFVRGAKRFSSSITRGFRGFGLSSDKETKKSRSKAKRGGKKKHEKPKANSSADIRIGSEINLLEAPWVDCQGIYSCKAIRRPGFVENAMLEAAAMNQEVANAGFAGAGAMFRSFTQSARSVLEESFLMITESHIIEMRSSKLNLSTGTVVFAIPVDMMAKLKFRRQESLSLFFKVAPDDPLVYMCPDSANCVHQIQSVLKQHGVKGKHTNAATHRAINEALQLVQEIQTKEIALKHDPTVARVNEIMDLYRQAAERFEAAGDVRHEEVVTHMRKFLALPFTSSILDGSYKGPGAGGARGGGSSVPEGEVLERYDAQLQMDDGDESKQRKDHRAEDRSFEENMENILKEAKDDLATFGVAGNEAASPGVDGAQGIPSDAFADLDAMLSEADKELAELMKT